MSHPTGHASLTWRKSSYSGNSDSQCVEVAPLTPLGLDRIGVRDSKHPAGPVLTLGPNAFSTFTASIRTTPGS